MTEDFFSEEIRNDLQIDFLDKDKIKIVAKNGSPCFVSGIDAIKQWIVKFCNTEKDTYPIYEGTGFGTRFKQLYGHKRLGYGYEEAEIERDFREGLPLCPAISQITNFELSKTGKVLKIHVEVELYNGEFVNVDIAKAYVLSVN